MEQQVCSVCHFPISDSFYYCPNCGRKVKEPPLSTTLSRQIGIYLLSLFLPPLGLWPGVKYFRQKDEKTKTIGVVAIALTLISTIVTLLASAALVNQFNKTVNTQFQQYQNYGF